MKESIQNIHTWLETAKPEFGSKEKLALSVNLIHEELKELSDSLCDHNRDEIIDAVADLWWVINNVTYYYGISPVEIESHLEKVKTSNFSKFCKTLDEAIETVKAYKFGDHPSKPNQNIETYYEYTNNEEYPFVVLRKSDDKILKSLYYKDVADLK